MRRLLRWSCWSAVIVSAIVASALWHLDTSLGRRLARTILNDYVSGEMVGTLEVGPIKQLRLWKTIVHDTSVFDPQGDRVIFGKRVELKIDPIAALKGKLRFTQAQLFGGDVTLIDNAEESPTFIDAFGPSDTSPSDPNSEPFHAMVEDMTLHGVTVHGDLLGLRGLRIKDVSIRGRMEFLDGAEFHIWSTSGRIVEPFPFEAPIDHLVATIFTDERGSTLYASSHRADEKATVKLSYRPEEGKTVDDPYVLDLLMHADPIKADTLKEVGFEWAYILTGAASGYVRLAGKSDRLTLNAKLDSDAGPATVSGVMPTAQTSRIKISSSGAALPKVLEDAPDVYIGGDIVFVTPPGEDASTTLEINANPFEYEGVSIPAVKAKATLGPDGASITDLSMPYGGGRLKARGGVDYAGNVDMRLRGTIARLQSDANVRRMLPDLKGSATMDLRIKRNIDETMNIRGWLTLNGMEYGAIKATELHLDGQVKGHLERPIIDLEFEGDGVDMGGYPIGRGKATIKGGPKTYRTRGSFAAKGDRRIEFDSRVIVDGDSFIFQGDSLEMAVGDVVWRGRISDFSYTRKSQISIGKLQLANGSQRLEATGLWRFKGSDDIRVELQNFDLAALKLVFPDDAPDIAGYADLHLEFKGDLDESPFIVAEGTLRDGRVLDIDPVTAAYLIRYAEGDLQVDAQVNLGGRGNFSLSGSGLVDPDEGDPIAALKGGVYEVDINAGTMDMALLEHILGEDAREFQGYADGSVHLSGPIDAPSFKGKFSIPQFQIADWKPMEIASNFHYEYGSLVARFLAKDEEGLLFDSEGSLLIDLAYFVRERNQALATLETSPWRISARIPPRRLEALPKSVLKRMPQGSENIRLAASATFAGGAFRTRGDLQASIDWRGAPASELCSTNADPRATLVAHLENDKTVASLIGHVDTTRVLTVDVEAPTPLDAWLRNAVRPEAPVMQIHAKLEEAPTQAIPFLCRYAGGTVNGDLIAKDLFGAAPEANISIVSDALSARRVEPAVKTGGFSSVIETPPSKLAIDASIGKGIGTLKGDMQWWNGGTTSIEAKTPMVWNLETKFPQIGDEGELDAQATFDRMPLQAALAWMAGIVNVEGILEGSITARGPTLEPELAGQLLVSDGRVDMRTFGQTLRHVEGRVIFDEDGALLRNFKATDGGGLAKIDGEVALKGIRPTQATLRLKTEGFPIRQEGSIVAILRGNARVTAKVAEEGVDGQLTVGKLDVDIPESTVNPQDLADHPEVFLVDEDGEPTGSLSPYFVKLKIKADKRFTVRSEEQGFQTQASAELQLDYDDPDFLIDGNVELHGGYFEVFGKQFQVQSGSMLFSGEKELNPRINLVAAHSLRGTSDSITVTASGRLNNPVVEFRSTVPTESEAQIIALLLTGNTRQERGQQASTANASADATNFLGGVAGGLLASTLRGNLGKLAPTFGLKTEDTNTKFQIGFNVERIIPDFLRQVIQGLYVEGTFTSRESEGGTNASGQALPGVLVEAQWPKNWVATFNFDPPSNWAIDVTWEP